MDNKKITFKELLSDKKVEIPILQRDYVQGNLQDRKAISIRLDFVEDLIQHLSVPNATKMSLDFIYGKLVDDAVSEEQERQKEQLLNLLDTVDDFAKKSGFELNAHVKQLTSYTSKDTFIPFDGQQRLTTLFLLHFLVYAKAEQDLTFLHQFTYKTRESSRDFLKALLQNHVDFQSIDIWRCSFVEFILDRNWFYNFWKYDPTVMSMIVMLDTFREKLNEFDDLNSIINTIYKNLEDNLAICFDYLDIDEHQLDDILYVKMNASGKELTDFEKFKSWLIEFSEAPINNMSGNCIQWQLNLDNKWYDIFWEADRKNTDKYLYQFINKMLAFYYCCQVDFNYTEDLKERQKLNRLVYQQLNNKEFIPFRFYDEHNIISSHSLQFIWDNLEMLASDNYYNSYEKCIRKIWNNTFIHHWDENESFRNFLIKNIGNFNLFHQTFVFAIFHYINQLCISMQELDENNFCEWLRIIRNLIYNSRIDDDIRFFNAIQSIYEFGDKCLSIKTVIKNENFIDFFPDRQRIEEFEKNKSFYNNWQDDLILAEDHTYFYGQINFLIELSKVDNLPNLDRFRYLYSQLSKIFSEENLNGVFLISQCLLTLDNDWMPDYGSNRRLLCLSNRANSRDRDENWRRVFNHDKYKYLFVELADLYACTNSLEEIIKNRKNNIFDWRRLILDYPNELTYCKQGLINYMENSNYIRLLGQSRLSHYHRELRTSVLFNHFLKDKFNLDKQCYVEMKTDENCFINFPIRDKILKIYYDKEVEDFKYFLLDNENEIVISENEYLLKNSDLIHQIERMNLYSLSKKIYHNQTN